MARIISFDEVASTMDGAIGTQSLPTERLLGDYKYEFIVEANGWRIEALSKNEAVYGNIKESVDGYPVVSMQGTFRNCTYMIESPAIPQSVIDMDHAYFMCVSLKDAPVIPHSVKYLRRTFYGCKGLTESPRLPDDALDITDVLAECTGLRRSQSDSQGESGETTSLQNRMNNTTSARTEPAIENGYKEIRGDYQYIFDSFSSGWRVEVTAKDKVAYGAIETNLQGYPVIDMSGTFLECAAMLESPVIPDTVVIMNRTYTKCTSLRKPPLIPISVQDLSYAFYGCSSLEELPEIRMTGIKVDGAFIGCTSIPESLLREGTTNISSTSRSRWHLFKALFRDTRDRVDDVVDHGRNASDKAKNVVRALKTRACIIEDYKYSFSYKQFGWKVRVVDKGKTSYGPIPKTVDGFPIVSLRGAFRNCRKMTQAPAIPDSVTDLTSTYYRCAKLTATPVIPKGVTKVYETFWGCTSLSTPPIWPEGVVDENRRSF